MYCEKCGTKLEDGAKFCPNCGHKTKAKNKNKNIYLALILTFILTGLGSIYAGNTNRGLRLLGLRILFIALGVFVNFLLIISLLVWAYGFWAAYQDVEKANGRQNPNLISDYKNMNPKSQKIAIVIAVIVIIFTIIGTASVLIVDSYDTSSSGSHYYTSSSPSSSHSSSSHSHYGGVDTSPSTIAKNDPDWYYDHYEYGDNDKIDEYLESQGFD